MSGSRVVKGAEQRPTLKALTAEETYVIVYGMASHCEVLAW